VATDERLKEGLMGLMPVACKKPGSRLQRKMGGPVKCPTGLQEKTLLLGKFLKVGLQGICHASPGDPWALCHDEERMVKTFWRV
jgi:hypothetical protein